MAENQQIKSDAALREEAILKFWKEKNIFPAYSLSEHAESTSGWRG